VEGVRGIKAKDGADLILSGTSALLEQGLADEVILLVYPVLLGKGKRLFAEGTPPRAFALESTKALPSGILIKPIRPLDLCRT
jgi:dihydrofolate reductase